MSITITAFERSPDGGMGLARDTRVRGALEEAGPAYEVRPVSFPAMKGPAHLAVHPFGQIPTYEESDLVPLVIDRIRHRLNQLTARLGDGEWLDGAFPPVSE